MSTTPLPDVSMRQLEYLVAVADADTWSAAAAEVGVSPSALSQGLAELERRLGVTLFESVGRRRVLRAAATPVLEHARQVIGLTADLVGWSERVRTGRHGRVRVGMIDIAAVVHVPHVVRQMRDDHPEVDLTLRVAPSAALLDDLRDGELDIAVCVEPSVERVGIDFEPLLEEGLSVIAPAGSSLDDPTRWGPWLLFPVGSHTRLLIEERLRALGAPVRVEAESHQPDVLVQLVALGAGWSVLPARQVDDAADVVVGAELVRRRLVVARRSGAIPEPAVDEVERRLRAA